MTGPTAGPLAAFNRLPADEAQRALLDCCASPAWASALAGGRPYAALPDVLAAADRALTALDAAEVEAAVAVHPRLGAPPAGDAVEAGWSRREQSAFVGGAAATPAELLAAEMWRYEERFGRVFLIDALGLDRDAVAVQLRRRLGNSPEAEAAEVRVELHGIVGRRLTRMLT